LSAEGGGDGQEGDGEPADKVGEHEQRHPLGDLGVVGVPGLGAAYSPVHLETSGLSDMLHKCTYSYVCVTTGLLQKTNGTSSKENIKGTFPFIGTGNSVHSRIFLFLIN
jgi:hypothetical protein